MMLLELTMKPPIKLSLGVPFVAANFQVATSVGIAASVLSVKRLLLPGDAPAGVIAVQALCLAGFALCFVFVVMTKLHYNFTENTGKALPKG
jgi:predicted phosphoribosyltransferase